MPKPNYAYYPRCILSLLCVKSEISKPHDFLISLFYQRILLLLDFLTFDNLTDNNKLIECFKSGTNKPFYTISETALKHK